MNYSIKKREKQKDNIIVNNIAKEIISKAIEEAKKKLLIVKK